MDSKWQANAARETEIDEVLAEFGGNARAAIGALLLDLETLARDRVASASFGYTRGRVSALPGARRPALDRVDAEIRIEAWSQDGVVIAVIATCDSLSVGHAAFEAAIKRYPENEVTLRDRCRLIARHSPPGTKTG